MPLLTIPELETLSPVFRGKAGNSFAGFLMRILSMEKINDLYDRHSDETGPDFARSVLNDLGVFYEIENMKVLDTLPDGPFITISNHPYGHIDGMMLVDLFGHLRRDYKVMVNGILGRVEAMGENFISVTPVGKERTVPANDSIRGVKDALIHVRQGHPMGFFPSGAVSDLSLKDGCIRDREWQEPVIRLIKKMNVPIVPVMFLDRNSALYYSLGLIDWKVRLLRLPSEVFNKYNKRTRIALGNIISPQEQDRYEDMDGFRAFLRSRVYGLKV